MCGSVRICFSFTPLSAVREDSSSNFYQSLPRLATSYLVVSEILRTFASDKTRR